MTDEVDFIVPVYNEGSNIASALAELYATVTRPKRVLIVYDFDEDDTVPVVRELAPRYPGRRVGAQHHRQGRDQRDSRGRRGGAL